MTDRYVAVPGIRALDFDEEWIVFNPLSWDAHLLNAAAALVLESLRTEPRSEESVAAYLRELLVETERAAAPEHARRLLDELVQLNLVNRIGGDVPADR